MEELNLTLSQESDVMRKKEHHFFDYKRSQLSVAKFEKILVAFANGDGGEIYLGIDEDETLPTADRIYGFPSQEAANQYTRAPEHLIDPPLQGVTMTFEHFPAKPAEYVLHVIVPKSDRVHYTSAKECFKRINAESLPIKGKDIERLVYTKGLQSFEDAPCEAVRADELEKSDYLKTYLERVPTAQPVVDFLSKQKLLIPAERLRLLGPPIVRVAGVMMFEDIPQAGMPSKCGIKIARLRTSEKTYDRAFLDGTPETIEGPCETLIHKAVARVVEIMAATSMKVKGGYRKYRYPKDAIHEIIANAVIHRDYYVSDDVHIRIYDNRIEVISPGKLPGHITVENMLTERFMRNNQIARLLNRLPDPPNKDMGEGLDTAFRAMIDARLKEPDIEELENAVRVTLLHEDIASREHQIIEYLKLNKTITNKQARGITGVKSEQGIYKTFVRMMRNDLIELVDESATVFNRSYRLKDGWEERFKQEMEADDVV